MTAVAFSLNATPQVNTLFGASGNAVQTAPSSDANTSSTVNNPAQAQDRFLKLLVAQLNNQDPMNPMDNAQMTSQMAQINTVTGIQQLNQTVTSLMNQFASMQMMQSSGLVGHDVLVEGNSLTVDGSAGKGAVALSGAAQSVVVSVLDPSGNTVKSQSLGSLDAGNHAFDVDLSDVQSSGPFTIKVSASNGSQPVGATPLICDKVVSISTGAQGVSLDMSSGKSVPYLSLKTVL